MVEGALEVIRIDVGGHRYSCSSRLLEKCPRGSPLRELLLQPPGSSGCYFIDRDGRLFCHVLNFLRDGRLLALPTEPDEVRQLYHEACHYKLFDLALAVQSGYAGAPSPPNEEARLQKLHNLGIAHSSRSEIQYDNITQIVKSLLGVPIVLISLVGKECHWFMSKCGLDLSKAPRNTSFCAYTFLSESPEILTIEDAATDPRTCNNPLVIGDPRIGFYAGCPLLTSDGFRLGTLCVFDYVPRKMQHWQYQALVSFGHLAVQEIQRAELQCAGAPTDVARETHEAWQAAGTGQVPSRSYESGLLRLCRMKEALEEIVCLVQLSSSCTDWPILYADQGWVQATGMRVHPLRLPLGLDAPAASGALLNRPSLWDFLSLDAGTEESLLRNVRAAWEALEQPHVFGLSARLASARRGPGRWPGPRPVSCRLAPVHEALDLAAGAVGAPAG
ncbi:unnamed protein product, partial [Prorocentrum cordatum]